MAHFINLRYKCKGFNFNAEINIHFYFNKKEDNIPIKLYNLDKPEWNTKTINFISFDSVISFDFIYKESIKWINEVLGLNYELEK